MAAATTTALPALTFVPPPVNGSRLEFSLASATTLIHQEWTGRGLPLSLEEMLAFLDALVPYDLVCLHGQPFAVSSAKGGEEHRFATLVGAYAVAGLALAGTTRPETSRFLVEHVRQRLAGHHEERLHAAGIVGGNRYLELLANTLAIEENMRLANRGSPRLWVEAALDFGRLVDRASGDELKPLRRHLREQQMRCYKAVAQLVETTATANRDWSLAWHCAHFRGDTATRDQIVKTAYHATPSVNLLSMGKSMDTATTWPIIEKAIAKLPVTSSPEAGVVQMAPPTLYCSFQDRAVRYQGIVANVLGPPTSANVPVTMPLALSMTAMAVLYGRLVGTGENPVAVAELRRRLLEQGVAAADLEPSLTALAGIVPSGRGVWAGAVDRVVSIFRPSVPAPMPIPAPLPPIQMPPSQPRDVLLQTLRDRNQ